MSDEPFAAARVRAAVESFAAEHGLPQPATFDLKVAATEALANALKHGAPPVTVTLACRNGSVEVEISDCGEFPPNATPSPDGGRGIPLMIALADDMRLDYDGGGTRVLLRKSIHAPCADELTA